MVPFSFAGRDMIPLADAALFWPARGALLIADLHLEKASWYAQYAGQMLPPYDSAAAITRVEALIGATQAREVWCLGDSFHDAAGIGRLAADARTRIAAIATQIEWTWIVGNHDAGMEQVLGGSVLDEALVDGIRLRHRARIGEGDPEISGHFHPQIRLTLRGRHVSRRCFVSDGQRIILPAFGALAGGLSPAHPEILKLMHPGVQALVPIEGKLLRFPLDRACLEKRNRNNSGNGTTVADMMQDGRNR